MKHLKTRGFISIEVVITASFILAVGFFALMNFSTSGTSLMDTVNGRLAGLGIFGGSGGNVGSHEADENGYPASLGIDTEDINPSSDFTFALNGEGNGYIITAYLNLADTDVVIPRVHEGLPVVEIGESAFDGWVNGVPITSVAIPNSIKTIGMYAFYENKLTTVIIPDSVTELREGAFMTGGIEHVTFVGAPPAVLGEWIFDDNNLGANTILVPDAHFFDYLAVASNFAAGNNAVYCKNMPVAEIVNFDANQYESGLVNNKSQVNPWTDFELEWDDSRAGWAISSFLNNEDKSLVIPAYSHDGEKIVSIYEGAFKNLNLTSVEIPNTIIDIYSTAFKNNRLTSIHIPSSVKWMGLGLFNNNLLPQEQAYFFEIGNPENLISYGGASKDIVIPARTTIIGERAFEGSELTSVVFPEGLSYIYDYAFANNHLEEVNLPSNIYWVARTAFSGNPIVSVPTEWFGFRYNFTLNGWEITEYYSSGPKDVVIPAILGDLRPVVSIAENAFRQREITSVTFPDSIKSIGNYAFYGNQLTEVVIPDGVTNISAYVFANNELTSVVIPDNATIINSRAFENNKLTSVIIPNNVTRIWTSAFRNNQLTSVVIGTGVTGIEDWAFETNQLTSVTLPNSLTRLGSSAFAYNELTSVTIPSGVREMMKEVFLSNELTSVRFLGARPTTLGTNIFTNNPGLVAGSVRVPSANLASYQSSRVSFGVIVGAIVAN